jgi:alkylhydroperoxidase family enzyme
LLAFLVPFQVARDQGLNDSEVLDLIHAIAIFAWANRLMLNLGEPVIAGQSSV